MVFEDCCPVGIDGRTYYRNQNESGNDGTDQTDDNEDDVEALQC